MPHKLLSLDRWWVAPAVVALYVLLAGPALAQDAAGASGKQVSWFQMFFWSGDTFGLIQTWTLILMSVAVTALVIQACMVHRAKVMMPAENMALYEDLLDQKQYTEAIEQSATDPSMFGQVLHASLSEASSGYGAMQRAIEEQADLQGTRRIRSLEYLNVLGAVGPMLGLFGTVYGMILAFQQIVNVGGQPKPADLAAGISTALVTTFWGLIVGMPAVAASALLRSKIDELTVQVMIRAEEMIARFKPGKRAAAGAAPSAPKPRPSAPQPKPAAATAARER